jgi:hypothetical protein
MPIRNARQEFSIKFLSFVQFVFPINLIGTGCPFPTVGHLGILSTVYDEIIKIL